jgi:hypothetical protein
MRCFYVLAHATIHWLTAYSGKHVNTVGQPEGFWCHRFVLAPDAEAANSAAFRRIKDNLERQFGWLSNGSATVDLEAADVSPAPLYKLLKPDNKGHTFY